MEVTVWIEPSIGLSIAKKVEIGSTIAMLKAALAAEDTFGSVSAKDIVLVNKGCKKQVLGDALVLTADMLELEFGSPGEAGGELEDGMESEEAAQPGWDAGAQRAVAEGPHQHGGGDGAEAGATEEARRKEEELWWMQWVQEEEGKKWLADKEEQERQHAAWEAREVQRREREAREWQGWAAQGEERRRQQEEADQRRKELEDQEERERQLRAQRRAENAERRKQEEQQRRQKQEELEQELRRRAEEEAEVTRRQKEAEQKAMHNRQTIKNTAAGARKLLGNPLQYQVGADCPAYAEPMSQASKSPPVKKGTWVFGFPGSAAWVLVDRRTSGLPTEAMLMKEIWMPVKSQEVDEGPGEPVLHANWSDLRAEKISESSLEVVWPGVGQPVEPNTAEYTVEVRPKQEPPAKGTPAASGTSKTRTTVGGLEKDSEVQVRVALRIVGPYTTNFRIFGVWVDFQTAKSGTELCSVNKALGRLAKASSTKSQDRLASFAVDGTASTRWTSTYADGQWLSVDLGHCYSVLRVEIRWETAHAKHYLIQGSEDEEKWVILASEMGREGWVMTTLPSGSKARFVRMYGQTRATNFGFSIYEMKVFVLDSKGSTLDLTDAALEADNHEPLEDVGEGVYEVVHTFVTLRAEPSTKGTILGTIKQGWYVFGTPLRIAGQPWTKLSAQTIPPVEKSLPPRNITAAESVWALIDATGIKSLGLGELLRRVGDGASSGEMRRLGEWRVVADKVDVREKPSTGTRGIGSQRRGSKVLGVCFPIGGLKWLRVQNPPGMEGPTLWLLIDGNSESQGQLLERLRDAPEACTKKRAAALPASRGPMPPRPLTASWLAGHGGLPKPPAAAREALLDADVDVGMASQCTLLCVKPADGGSELQFVAKRGSTNGDMASCEREYRFYSELARRGAAAGAPAPEMLGGVLRIPQCLCASWGKEGKERDGFILILELLGKPDWVHVDPERGCTREQGITAVEALGRMHKAFSNMRFLDELSWLPVTLFDVRNADHIQQFFSMTVEQAGTLVQMLPPPAQVAVERMSQGGLGECFERLGTPPLTLNHGDYRPENLRFSAPGRPPAVAAFDWGLVNCARGVADFAYFLMLSFRPEERRQFENELLEKYLRARGDYSERAMQETREDLKSASLAILGMILMTRHCATLGFTQGTRIMLSRMMRWVGEAIMDWCSITVLPD